MGSMIKLDTWTNARGKTIKIVHGEAKSYDKGCRCDECKEAFRERAREAKGRRLSRPIPEHVHGTWNGYSNYNCRCPRCLAACQAKYPDSAAYRQANRARLNERRRSYYRETGK